MIKRDKKFSMSDARFLNFPYCCTALHMIENQLKMSDRKVCIFQFNIQIYVLITESNIIESIFNNIDLLR
jgi:hypothetical protein